MSVSPQQDRPQPDALAALAQAALQIAETHEHSTRRPDALALLAAALRIITPDEQPALAARLTALQGRLLLTEARRETGRFDAAIAALEQAHQLADAMQDMPTLARASDSLGLARYFKRLLMSEGDWDSARSALEQARTLYQQLGDQRGEAQSLFHLGLIAQMSGARDQAAALYQASLEQAVRSGDRSTEASNHRHLASLYQSRGELALAHQHFGTALEIVRGLGIPPFLAASLAAMGDITYAYHKDAEAALVYFQEGLALAEQHNDHAYIGTIHRSLGTIAADRKEYDTARRHLAIALAETEQVEDHDLAKEIRAALAQLPRA